MRSIVALAILLLGLNAAAAEASYQDSLPVAGEQSFTSSLEFDVKIDGPDLKIILTMPSELYDAPHDQGDTASEPPHAPAPATTSMAAKTETLHSVGDLCHALLVSAEDNGLPVPFFANLIWQESRLKLDAKSRVGALGIAQFMPSVAREVGLVNPFDPRQAIPASARFLHGLRALFGNLGFVAAAYNAGAHRVADWLDHRRALPLETRTYVVRVTGRSAEAWRKSPVQDSQVAFTGELPCRKFSAFAELEQDRLREARQVEEAERQARQPEKVTTKVARTVVKTATKVTQRVVEKVAAKLTQKVEKKLPATHHPDPEPKIARAAAAGKIAGNLHSGKHEATRRPHIPHEKRRVAQS
jgi:Transglycosylase SLT domain